MFIIVDKHINNTLDGDSMSEAIIFEKAIQLHSELLHKYPCTSSMSDEFRVSRWWF